jgi:two-component system sensor histidine kinase KdpD
VKISKVWLECLFSVFVVGICSGISVMLRNHLALENFAIIYMFGVLAVSVRCSRGPAMANAFLAVGSFHYFCVPPFDTFIIEDYDYAVTLVGMLTIALVTTTLTMKIRKQAEDALRREEQTKELYRLRELAEMEVQKERTRNLLLSAVSHDLKTPLASIYGAATSLLEGEERLDPAERRELAQSISGESERLNRVLTNLLDMTRLESGRQLVRDWYPIEEILGAAFTRLERALRGRSLSTEIPPDLPLVWVDDVLLEQVFINLLENAVKYTPAGAAIRVSAHVGAGLVEVIVQDSGPGFAKEDEALVFDKFFRGKVEGVRGVGLGLAICKAIIERHDGTITAANVASGGAMIRFTLPVGAAPPQPQTITEDSRHD